jgi:Na+-transporting NADH:ubiquinone oxidoreductase subunit C
MKNYLRMLTFVLVMGLLTSGVFVGMELWTGPLIAANEANEIKTTILDAYDVPYTLGNIADVFEDAVEVETIDDITFYIDKNTGRISYQFAGGGVWGEIIGVITLEADFTTIVRIRILEQQETPGLGGIVATSKYLNTFTGISMLPQLEINQPDASANKPNEVDTITGATRTSKAFEAMLNESYTAAAAAWAKGGN